MGLENNFKQSQDFFIENLQELHSHRSHPWKQQKLQYHTYSRTPIVAYSYYF